MGRTVSALCLLIAAYYVVCTLIDERIARWTWPRASDQDDSTPPRVPEARIWTFTFRWTVPFVESLLTARGIPCTRDMIMSRDKLVIESIKIEEFMGRARLHLWSIAADSSPGSYYYWEDRPRLATWLLSKTPLNRDDLLRDSIWSLDFTELFHPSGRGRVLALVSWRR